MVREAYKGPSFTQLSIEIAFGFVSESILFFATTDHHFLELPQPKRQDRNTIGKCSIAAILKDCLAEIPSSGEKHGWTLKMVVTRVKGILTSVHYSGRMFGAVIRLEKVRFATPQAIEKSARRGSSSPATRAHLACPRAFLLQETMRMSRILER